MKALQGFMGRFESYRSLVGSTLWILSIQYFITQLFVASSWSRQYSLLHNTISDLGNTACGLYRDTFICSPSHSWMNASFIVLGLSMSIGSVLLRRQYAKNTGSTAGFWFMCLAGLGTAVVGLFPENTIGTLHVFGAALPFLVGNVALVILGYTLRIPHALRYYTLISGVIALAALILFLTHTYLGIGIGGMERITAYPQTIWLIVFGIYSICLPQRRTYG
jgi:hypothetical membrane protein